MTKTELIRRMGSEYAVAKLFNCSRQAVNRWANRIPALRLYQLRELKPEWFRKNARH